MRWKKQKDEQPRRRQLSEDRSSEKRQTAFGGALFKRNRTITGSLSTSVSSVNELGGDLRSPRVHAHHLAAHRRRLGSVLSLVVLASAFLLWLLYEFTASVHVSPTESSVIIQFERYEKAINDYFALHPIERLRVLLNDDDFNDYVRRATPEVASIHAGGAAGFATTQFDVTLRKPIAGWLIGNTQYYVDNSGIAFQTNYFGEPAVKIIDQSGVPQTAGTTVASSRFLSFVGRAVSIAHTYDITVEQAILPLGTTRQIELRIAGHSYPIKLSLDRPVGEQIEDMQRAIAYMDSKKMTPKYIDVRVSGRAFYQ